MLSRQYSKETSTAPAGNSLLSQMTFSQLGDYSSARKPKFNSFSDSVLLKREYVKEGTYKSTIVDIKTSDKDETPIVYYSFNEKNPDGTYAPQNTLVRFFYFSGSPRFREFEKTLATYGMNNTNASDLLGLTEEVTVVYIENDAFGYLRNRTLLAYPKGFKTVFTSSDEELPF